MFFFSYHDKEEQDKAIARADGNTRTEARLIIARCEAFEAQEQFAALRRVNKADEHA